MFDLDGSETSWLVYADYLEDQDIDASHIRESIANPCIDQWCQDSQGFNNSGVGVDSGVGNSTNNNIGSNTDMNTGSNWRVGSIYSYVGSGIYVRFRSISIPLVRRIFPQLVCLITIFLGV
jgi:hypothetical protein